MPYTTSRNSLKPFNVTLNNVDKQLIGHFKDKLTPLDTFYSRPVFSVPHGFKINLPTNSKDSFMILWKICKILNSDQDWLRKNNIKQFAIGHIKDYFNDRNPWGEDHLIALGHDFNITGTKYDSDDSKIVFIEGNFEDVNTQSAIFDKVLSDTPKNRISSKVTPELLFSKAVKIDEIESRSDTQNSVTTNVGTEITSDLFHENSKSILDKVAKLNLHDISKLKTDMFLLSKEDKKTLQRNIEKLREGAEEALNSE